MDEKLPRIGAHLPIGKGLQHTADEAVAKGLESLQVFVRNPRGRSSRQFSIEELDYFTNTLRDNDIGPVAVHIPYICNLAASRDDLYALAYEIVCEDLERARLIKADYIVLHPGSYTNSSLEQGIDKIANLLDRVLDKYEGPTRLLLETMAGQGTEIGRTFSELNQILQAVKNKDNIGICFDTCHTFAAGYNCADKQGLHLTIEEIAATFGKEKIMLVHANDSSREAGSHRDRHAHIGEGFIGEAGFARVMSHDFFKHIPFILETPVENIDQDVERLKNIRERL